MKYSFTCLVLALVLSFSMASAQTVSLKKLVHIDKMSRGTSFAYKGLLYATYGNGALYRIDLSNGNYSQVGTTVFANTRFLFALNNQIFIIEKDGSMNQVDRETGNWKVVSPIGTWTTIERVIVVGNQFFTVENGALYHHPTMSDRGRRQIGGAEFFEMGIVMTTDTSLHSIVGGFLYNINTATGKWTKVGAKTYKGSRAGAAANNKIYTLDSPAVLFETNLADGSRKQIDDTHFTNYHALFSHANKLYCYTADDDLCEIVIGGN